MASACKGTAEACRCGQLVAMPGWSKTLRNDRFCWRRLSRYKLRRQRAVGVGSSFSDRTVMPSGRTSVRIGGPPMVRSSFPLTANMASRMHSDSRRRSRSRHRNWLSGSTVPGRGERGVPSGALCAPCSALSDACRYTVEVMISLMIGLTRQPLLTNSLASHSSNSGCVGGVPVSPKLSAVGTIPRPMRCSQIRLTMTRANSAEAGDRPSVNQRASALLRPLVAAPGLPAGIQPETCESESTRSRPGCTSLPGVSKLPRFSK